jgi:hypothetical protein
MGRQYSGFGFDIIRVVKPSLSVLVPSLVLTTAVWLYFESAGYPLTGPALVVVLALCFGVVLLASTIWNRFRTRKVKDAPGNR